MSLASRPLWQVCFVCGATIELFLQCWANNMLRNQIFVAVLGWFQPINHDLSLCLTESPLFCSFSHENRLFLWDKTLGINIFCYRIESRIRSSENLSQWNHWDLVHDLFWPKYSSTITTETLAAIAKLTACSKNVRKKIIPLSERMSRPTVSCFFSKKKEAHGFSIPFITVYGESQTTKPNPKHFHKRWEMPDEVELKQTLLFQKSYIFIFAFSIFQN